jgi:lysyl-tRNA synthetase class 2
MGVVSARAPRVLRTYRERPRRSRHLLAVAVGAAGIVNLVSAVLPAERQRLEDIRGILPLSASHVATTATAIAGVALIVLARQLWRGKHVAMVIAAVLLFGSVLLHLAKGFDFEEATFAFALAAALLWRRRDFTARSDPASLARFFDTAPLLVVGAYVYGVGALYVRHRDVKPAVSLWHAVQEVSYGLVGLRGPLQIHGRFFSDWFPASLLAYGVGALVFLAFLFFRPVVQRLQQNPAQRALARTLVAANDDDSLSYFALRDDKDYFFNAERTAFLAYRYVAGVGLISGDPIGPKEAWPDLLDRFRAYAAERDWMVAAIGSAEASLAVYEDAGLRTKYLGDEAVIDVGSFTLEGRKMRNVRQSWNHVRRAGYSCRVLSTKEVSHEERAACRRLSARWRGNSAERGFSMALGRLFAPEDPDCLLVLASDARGEPRAFLHLVPYASGRGASLEAMRRDRDAPGGMNEFLIVEAVEQLKRRGVEQLSLNFATFASHLAPIAGFHPIRRVWRRALLVASRFFQIESLLRFNRKFCPGWSPRYAVYEDPLDIPRLAVAMLTAEAFVRLPLVGRYW